MLKGIPLKGQMSGWTVTGKQVRYDCHQLGGDMELFGIRCHYSNIRIERKRKV